MHKIYNLYHKHAQVKQSHQTTKLECLLAPSIRNGTCALLYIPEAAYRPLLQASLRRGMGLALGWHHVHLSNW